MRYVSQRELDTDFFCHIDGCVYNDMDYLVRWVRANYVDRRDEFRSAVAPLVAEEMNKRKEGKGK